MKPWICRNLILKPIYALRKEPVLRYRLQVRHFFNLPHEKQKEQQWMQLRSLLRHATDHSPYYRNLFKENAISLEDIETPEDFQRVPLTTKQQLRENIESVCVPVDIPTSARKTSGSTGEPLLFKKDRIATAYMDAVMYEVYGWHGVQIGDRQACFWGLPLDKLNRRKWQAKDLLLNRIRYNSFKLQSSHSVAFYHALRKFKPRYIYGYPSAICQFIEHLQGEKIAIEALSIPTVIATGEVLYQEQRQTIESALNTKVVNEFGNTENGIIAFECEAGNMHLMNHNLYVEILDPHSKMPVKDGQTGTIVLTELHSTAFPFIRYWTNDLATSASTTCSCGRHMPIIDCIEGRVSDLIVTPDGTKIAGPIINYTMSAGIRKMKAIQYELDHIVVEVEPSGKLSQGELTHIAERWKSLVGSKVKIDIRPVQRIAADKSGKLRAFESRISSG